MAGKGLAIAGAAIIAILVVVMFVLPAVVVDDGITFDSIVYGMKDGRRVTSPYAFIEGNVEVDSLGCDSSWVATGSGVDWDTLVIAGQYNMYLLDHRGTVVREITPADLSFVRSGSTQQDGAVHFSVPLDLLLIGQPYSGYIDTLGNYWLVKITWGISGSVNQEYEELPPLRDSVTDFAVATIYWQDGTFGLEGGIN